MLQKEVDGFFFVLVAFSCGNSEIDADSYESKVLCNKIIAIKGDWLR